jgi:WD40 repeat protein
MKITTTPGKRPRRWGKVNRTLRGWVNYFSVGAFSKAYSARLEGHSVGVAALCPLPDGRLASGSFDTTIRLWDLAAGIETARLDADAPIRCLTSLPSGRIVAGDVLGRLHWLEIVD